MGIGLGCGTSIAPQAPPQAYVDSGKDAPAPQPFDAGTADVATSDAAVDAVADQIAPQPPPQPPQPPPQPPQPPPQPPQMPPP